MGDDAKVGVCSSWESSIELPEVVVEVKVIAVDDGDEESVAIVDGVDNDNEVAVSATRRVFVIDLLAVAMGDEDLREDVVEQP
jgi:hypothetical protein